MIRELRIKDDSREVSSPADKTMGDQDPRKLEGAEASKYRAMVARMNQPGQDRSDLANTVKEPSKDMCSPDSDIMAKMKRLKKILEGKTKACYHVPIPGFSGQNQRLDRHRLCRMHKVKKIHVCTDYSA